MTPKSQLEHKGNFHTYPFAEILAEIAQGQITGSLRLSNGDQKCILYFKLGKVVFGVSNARSSRLCNTLIRLDRIKQSDLSSIPDFANDLALADLLVDHKVLTREESNDLFVEQIRSIIIDILGWKHGEWNFSSLARLRDGVSFEISAGSILVDYGRCLTMDQTLSRFKDRDESFNRVDVPDAQFSLNQNELSVLAKLPKTPTRIAEITASLSLPEHQVIQVLYALWLGGLVERSEWNPAFSESSVNKMRNAKLELKQEAARPFRIRTSAADNISFGQPRHDKIEETTLSLDEYLDRVEKAATYYDVLGVEPKAETAEIRKAYFGLAKVFHPDHFHQAGPAVLGRVQFAFTELAQAYETLKNADTRESYDFKVRKEIADKERNKRSTPEEATANKRLAAESFDRGFSMLMDADYENAIYLLARAAHLEPASAKYHAYYGKALSTNKTHAHKAESEMQAAIRLDPEDPTFRIMLAEFFVEMRLMKRAEGELTRMLLHFPGNREARDLLASIQQPA